MSELNQQKMYDEQDQQNNNSGSETKKTCLTCCCDYLKWSVKTACKMCECIVHCM